MQSTLFNAICENSKAQAANFPFCTIEPNIGIVAVPDSRLQVCRSFKHVITTLHAIARCAFCLSLIESTRRVSHQAYFWKYFYPAGPQ